MTSLTLTDFTLSACLSPLTAHSELLLVFLIIFLLPHNFITNSITIESSHPYYTTILLCLVS